MENLEVDLDMEKWVSNRKGRQPGLESIRNETKWWFSVALKAGLTV